MLSLDHQAATERCDCCDRDYPVSRGTVFEDGVPVAIYLAGLHPCDDGPTAILAFGFVEDGGDGTPRAVSIQVFATPDAWRMSLLDPADSPWTTHTYLGPMMSREEALESPHEDRIFAWAGLVVDRNPMVIAHFAAPAAPPAAEPERPARRTPWWKFGRADPR